MHLEALHATKRCLLYFLTQVYRIHKVHMVLRTPNKIYTQTNLNKLERDFYL